MSLRLLVVLLVCFRGLSLGSPLSSSEESDETSLRAPNPEAVRFAEALRGNFSPMPEHPTRGRSASPDIKPISAWNQHLDYIDTDQQVVAANKFSKLLGGGESKEKLFRDKTRILHIDFVSVDSC